MNRPVLRIALLADAAHVNCQRWCEGLTRAGAEVHLLSFAQNGPDSHLTYRLPGKKLPGKLQYIAAVPHVRRLLRSISPDLLVAYYVTGYGTLAALSGYHPLVQVTSGSDVLLAPSSPLMRRLVKFNLNRADLVTAWAPHMAAAARGFGVSNDRILTLPRGVPYANLAGARASHPKREGSISIITTRSLKSDYKFDLLLKAVRLVLDRGVNLFLTIAGDGPRRDDLVAQTKKLGIEGSVCFAGFISNDHLPLLLAQHDLYISLVDSDGVSASLLEAMAVGLLPLVPDHVANRFWIKPGENGLLLQKIHPEAVAESICRAFSDLPLRERAWETNSGIVRERGDLYNNSEQFVHRFRELAFNGSGSPLTGEAYRV